MSQSTSALDALEEALLRAELRRLECRVEELESSVSQLQESVARLRRAGRAADKRAARELLRAEFGEQPDD